jgi:acetylornithine deacetylase/succinyl-diaminopimelate desuccinylase-like protein
MLLKRHHALSAAVLACLSIQVAQAAKAPASVRAEARDIFDHVIAYKTSEGLGQVPAMANYLADKFRAGGFPTEDVHVLPLGETAALVVRYRGSGKGGKPILLMAHMDVVTARREDWQRDPYKLIEENGFFFGRGTSDIKCEVALLTTTFLRLKAEKFVPARDLIITFTGDEETSGATAQMLMNKYRSLVDGEYALNGDGGGGELDDATGKPTVYYVQGAEKSYASYTFTTHNPGGHSSQPQPENAIYELADALKALQAYQFPVKWNEWTLGSLKVSAAKTTGELGDALKKFVEHPGDANAAAVISKHPPLVGRIRTTCVATLLKGGHAENALPQSATATVNCRIFPGTGIDDVRETLQNLAGAKVEVKGIGHPVVGPSSPVRADVQAAVAKAVHVNYPSASITPSQSSGASDGTFFRSAGIPTYGTSSIFIRDADDFSHGLDERIPVASFYAGLDHWYVLIHELAGKH